MPLIPMVVEQSARGERSFDVYSRLLRRSQDTSRCALQPAAARTPRVSPSKSA